ncbi:MAG: hypothetical protein Q4G59_05865, partial [Planctomycetia bacterium]|nr:hypothetical protein [Planctomycetia bacterium]
MKINIFRNTAIILPLLLLAVTSSEATTNSILENGKSSNNAGKNIVKLAQVPSKNLPPAPGTEQNKTPNTPQIAQSVQLDSLSSFAPPRSPATVVNQRHFSIPFALTPSQNTGPFSVELLSTNDQGKTWVSSGKIECPSSQKEFYFRADRDGEYWFVLRTSFPGGNRKTSPAHAIMIKTGENGATSKTIKTPQTTQVSQTKKESSSSTTPTSPSAGLTVGAAPKNSSANSTTKNVAKTDSTPSQSRSNALAVPSLSLPSKTADSSLADTVESREERAKKLLELASTVPSDNGGKKATGSAPGQQTPSPVSVSPLASSVKANSPKGVTSALAKTDSTGKVANAGPTQGNTLGKTQEKVLGKVEKP